MIRLFIIIAFISLSFHGNGQFLNSNIGFEDGTFKGWRINNYGGTKSISQIVTSPQPVRFGIYSAFLTTQFDYRNELIFDEGVLFLDHQEYWLGQSIYLNNYTRDYLAWSTIMQMHTVPGNQNWDCNTPPNTWTLFTGHPDGDNNPNHLTFGFSTWDLTTRGLDPYVREPSPDGSGTYNRHIWSGGAIGVDDLWSELIIDWENKWVDIVVNWIPSSDSDGFIKVWINENLVVDHSGPNLFYYDRCGVPREPITYFQTGIYKEQSQSDVKREIYIDEIRIGDASASYNDVAPRGEPKNTPPVLSPVGNQVVEEGKSLNVFMIARDADGDNLSYSISSNLDFVTLTDDKNGMGTLKITPNIGDAGTYDLTVKVTDTKNAIDSEIITITIK